MTSQKNNASAIINYWKNKKFRVPFYIKHIILVKDKSPEKQKRGISVEREQRRSGTEQIKEIKIPFEAETRVVRNEGQYRPW